MNQEGSRCSLGMVHDPGSSDPACAWPAALNLRAIAESAVAGSRGG